MSSKMPGSVWLKWPRLDQRDHALEVVVAGDHRRGVVALAHRGDLLGGVAEEEEVLVAGLLADLDVGAVERADGQRAVHHELHVAGAGGLLAGGRDLLRQLGRGADLLHQRDAVVGQEGHAQQLADVGVAVDHGGDRVDEADDRLGHGVARRGLAAEQHRALDHALGVAALDAVVEVDDVQRVEQLALVLVQALDLDVEDRVEREVDAGVLLDHRGEVAPCWRP